MINIYTHNVVNLDTCSTLTQRKQFVKLHTQKNSTFFHCYQICNTVYFIDINQWYLITKCKCSFTPFIARLFFYKYHLYSVLQYFAIRLSTPRVEMAPKFRVSIVIWYSALNDKYHSVFYYCNSLFRQKHIRSPVWSNKN
jgi:hypothetical protein